MAYIPKYLNFQQERKIGEHTIYLPDPPNIRLIANRDKLEHKQKFQRTELPNGFEQWDLQSKSDFIAQEWDRRQNGYWFFNNGNLEYITGINYFYINWWTLEGSRPMFVDADRDFFLLWDYVVKNDQCYGLFYVTSRRTGKSHKASCILYESISRSPYAIGSMQSYNDDAASQIFDKLVDSWRLLPNFFKPVDTGVSNPKKELLFFEPSKRSTKGGVKEYEKVLNSRIDYKPSGIKNQDGRRLKFLIQDELCKTDPKIDIRKRYYNNKQTIALSTTEIIGKILCTTTSDDDVSPENWENAKKLWEESSIKTGNKYKISESGLITLTRKVSYGGYAEKFKDDEGNLVYGIDEYGYSRTDFVDSHIRKSLEGLSGYTLSKQRKLYPLDDSDFWGSKLAGFYDGTLLEEAKLVAEEEQEHTVRRVTFYETKEGLIDIKDDENGFWWICWDFKNKNESNRVEYDYRTGSIKPLNNMKFSMAYDPVAKDGDVKGGSSPAALVKMEYDEDYEDFFNTYVCLYYGRRRTWKEMDRDIEYMCRYYGCKVLVEGDAGLALNRMLSNHKTKGFSANSGINSVDLSKTGGKITKEALNKMREHGIRSGSAYALAQAKLLSQEYIIDNYNKLKLPMMIDDLLKYDDEKRTHYDISCAFQWCEFESDNKYKLTKKRDNGTQNKSYSSNYYAPVITSKKYF